MFHDIVISIFQSVFTLDNIAAFVLGGCVGALGIIFSGLLSRLPSKYVHWRIVRGEEKEDAVNEWVRDVREGADTAIDELNDWGETETEEIPQTIQDQREILRELKGRTDHPDADPPEDIDEELREAVQEFGELHIANNTEEARIELLSKLIILRKTADDYLNS